MIVNSVAEERSMCGVGSVARDASWRTAATIFVIALLVYGLVVVVVRLRIEPTGDEPHYLVVTRSIAYDFDLDVGNNYLDRHWKGFYGGDLQPGSHASAYGEDGAMASIHPIGLPALVSIPYLVAARLAEAFSRNPAWAGYLGSVTTLVFVASFLVAATFQFVAEVVEDRRAAAMACLAIFLTNPMLPYSSQIYPEVPAALAIIIGLWLGWRGANMGGWALIAGLAIAVLPWLHLRYVPVAFALFAYLLVRMWKAYRRGLLLVLGVNVVSVAAHALYLASAYGDVSPFAGYRGSPISIGTLWTGLPGLFLDQSHGLFAYAPMYVVILIAWLVLSVTRFGRQSFILPVALLLFVAEATVSSMHYTWTGGWSIPPRFLVPVVPLTALPLAIVLKARVGSLRRVALLGTLGLFGLATLAVVACTAIAPDLYYNRISSKLLVAASKGVRQVTGVPLVLNDYWPLMVRDSPLSYGPGQAHNDTKTGTLHQDDASPYKQTLWLDPSRDPPGFVTNLAYVYVRSGRYVATAHLKTDGALAGDVVAVMDVTIYANERPQIIASREVKGVDFAVPGDYQAFDVGFVYSGLDPVMFSVYYAGKAKLGFGGMTLARQ